MPNHPHRLTSSGRISSIKGIRSLLISTVYIVHSKVDIKPELVSLGVAWVTAKRDFPE